MERFEIALSLNDQQLLVPSMLPKEKPGMQLHQLQKLIAKRRKSDEKVYLEVEILLYQTGHGISREKKKQNLNNRNNF